MNVVHKILSPVYMVMQLRESLKLHKNKISRIKFGIKVGVAAGACYYLAEEGVWSESEKTSQLYDKICKTVTPIIKEATAGVPIELPNLPSSQRISFLSRYYWNNGVTSTFEFLGKLPEHASDWTSNTIDSMKQNPEMKKFVDSLKSAPPPPPPAPSTPEKKL